MAHVELTSARPGDQPPGALFIGLFWSILGTLALGGAIALLTYAAVAGWRV